MNAELKRRMDGHAKAGREAKEIRHLEASLDRVIRKSKVVQDVLMLRRGLLGLVMEAYKTGKGGR